jgi:hypothetical protein
VGHVVHERSEEAPGDARVPELLRGARGQYRSDLLDKEAAERIIVPTAMRCWDSGGWVIRRLQALQPSAFSEWQAMVDEARVAELIGGGGGEAAP